MTLPLEITRWVRELTPGSSAGVRLLCFPHAGGSAGYYRPLSRALPPAVDVRALQYPARQDRLREAGIASIPALTEQIGAVLTAWRDPRSIAFFGHSLGAILAFEVTRLLAEQNGPQPFHLLLSGRRAPCAQQGPEPVPTGDAAIVRELQQLSGTDAQLLDDETVQMFLPALRSDYAAVGGYRPDPAATVSCPITMLTGDADPRVTVDEAAAWAKHTDAAFDLHVYAGDHFYLAHHMPAMSTVIRDCLLSL
jgi:surfactin synthase thioesterase subunit